MRRFIDIIESVSSEQHIADICQEITSLVPEAVEVWFHGSRARGDHKPSSDWDFIAVVRDEIHNEELWKYAYADGPLESMRRNKIDVQVYKEAEKTKSGSVLWWAVEEGRMVWSKTAPNIVEDVEAFWSNRKYSKNKIVENAPVGVIRSGVAVDDLPEQVKADIVDMLIVRDTGFVEAYETEYGPHSLTDEHVRGEIFGVANSPLRVDILNLNPNDIDDEGRSVSAFAVQNYVRMLQKSPPPPVLVRHTGTNWRIVEGGHRVAAAKAAGSEMISAVDVTSFFQRDWVAYIQGEN